MDTQRTDARLTESCNRLANFAAMMADIVTPKATARPKRTLKNLGAMETPPTNKKTRVKWQHDRAVFLYPLCEKAAGFVAHHYGFDYDTCIAEIGLELCERLQSQPEKAQRANWYLVNGCSWRVSSKLDNQRTRKANSQTFTESDLLAGMGTDAGQMDDLDLLSMIADRLDNLDNRDAITGTATTLALLALPTEQRSAFLYDYFGYTSAETATRENCPASTVRDRVKRARLALQKQLYPELFARENNPAPQFYGRNSKTYNPTNWTHDATTIQRAEHLPTVEEPARPACEENKLGTIADLDFLEWKPQCRVTFRNGRPLRTWYRVNETGERYHVNRNPERMDLDGMLDKMQNAVTSGAATVGYRMKREEDARAILETVIE
jgi:hypothetical protein